MSHKPIKTEEEKKDVCKQVSESTIKVMSAQWCKNAMHNSYNLNDEDKISNLVCSTFPKCWKIDILKSIVIKSERFDILDTAKECNMHPKQVVFYADNCLFDYNFAGTFMCGGCPSYLHVNKPALIVAGGPSVEKYGHLDLLQKYGFNGDIICTDSMVEKLLNKGVIPKYMNLMDSSDSMLSMINKDIIHKYSDRLTGLFSTVTHPDVVNCFKGKKYFYNAFVNQLSYMFFLMNNTMQINTGGNIGSSSIILAAILGYRPIIFIGMDLSFETFDKMKEYYSNAYSSHHNPMNIQKNWEISNYKRERNPVYNKEYWIESVFEAYRNSTLNIMTEIASKKISLINCSEQGSLFADYIHQVKFEDYLKSQPEMIT